MDNKIITVSIIGVGARGAEAYGRYVHSLKDKFKIVSLCDVDAYRLKKYGEVFDVDERDRFIDENEFFSKRRSDVLFVTTMDTLHVRMAMRALDLGYDLLLEKPISIYPDELKRLVEKAKEKKAMVMVCHVLRYNVMIRKIKELLDCGAIGKLVSMEDTENVCFWHQAHSFVRGNWHNSVKSSPMIMQKCCHDMDLIQYFANSRCEKVSSFGSLAFFKKENMPSGASERCLDCKYKDDCKYSAKRIYIDDWINGGKQDCIPFRLITDVTPITEEALTESLRTTDYGRCVFDMDNDVVDNQTVIMKFENGITATLKMEGFTARGGRDMRFYGTEGEISLCEIEDEIVLRRFMEQPVKYKISELKDDLGGKGEGDHGGGDNRMIDSLYKIYTTNKLFAESSIEKSVESHYMALAAEKSRLNEGKVVEIKDYR